MTLSGLFHLTKTDQLLLWEVEIKCQQVGQDIPAALAWRAILKLKYAVKIKYQRLNEENGS